MDVLIPLGIGSGWEHNELRYCIRSLEENLLDLDKIFIIGHLPSFINRDKIQYFPFSDTFKHNKDANIIAKTIKAIDSGISENFIRISDDQIILKPIYGKDIKPLYRANLDVYDFSKINRWRNRLKNGFEFLKLEKKPTYNYESHIPVVYNGLKFKQIFSQYNWAIEKEGFTINCLYFNNIECERIKLGEEKIGFEKEEIIKIEEIKQKIENKIYLGYNNKGLSEELKHFIEFQFPNKSKYEY